MPKFSKVIKPVPRSRFLLIRCPDCGNEQVVFSHASTQVTCKICNRTLAKPTGGRAVLEAQVIQVLDEF